MLSKCRVQEISYLYKIRCLGSTEGSKSAILDGKQLFPVYIHRLKFYPIATMHRLVLSIQHCMVGVSTYDGVFAACIYFQTTRRINAVPTIL